MFNGTVDFAARIKGNGLTFPRLDFDPKEPSVTKVEIEGPNGDEILCTVTFDSVATEDDGRALATKVANSALDRIAFSHSASIENARSTGDQFSPINPRPGYHAVAGSARVNYNVTAKATFVLKAADLKSELQQESPPGELKYGLFRSARLSVSPVEEFMHLYHILLMIFNDSQRGVDKFIVAKEPAVTQSDSPRRTKGALAKETVYTRLRNEFAHKRQGTNISATKAEMANHLGGLVTLTRRAIELHS